MYFLQIKPNSDKYIDGVLSETIHKLLNSNSFNKDNDSIADMIELTEEYIKELSSDCIIDYINSHFATTNNTQITDTNYLIYPLSKNNKYYHLLLINGVINCNSYLNKMNGEEHKSQFNLIASSLSQFYNNNLAIFGDAFLIHIDCDCYNNLHKLNKEIDTSKIYNNYKYYNLFELMTDLYFINIYVKELNKIMIYSRKILSDYVNSNTPTILENNIIKITYNDLTLYIKTIDILVESHNYILNMLGTNNYYLSNITVPDIEFINK
jgi:hypothetical protein